MRARIPGRRERVRVVRRELERTRERGVRAGPIPVRRPDRRQLDVRFDQVGRELERTLHGRARIGVARHDGRAAVFGVEAMRPREAHPGERIVGLERDRVPQERHAAREIVRTMASAQELALEVEPVGFGVFTAIAAKCRHFRGHLRR